jgi:hypothetical protein
MTDCTLHKIDKSLMARMLHDQHDVSELFVKHLLSRTALLDHSLLPSHSMGCQFVANPISRYEQF